jgi:Flp pilus assembly protein TadG
MQKNSSLIRDESGAITMMTVILMAAFVGLMAIVIDLGHLHIVQNELGNAADACALRGARAFVPDDLTGMTATAPDPDNAKTQASLTVVNNRSDDKALTDLPIADIQVGVWNCETGNWVGGAPVFSWPPDSSYWGHYVGPGISLPTQKTTSYNAGPVTMTLANIFGIATVPVKAKATAYLSPIGGPTPSTPIMPFGPMAPPPASGPFTGWFRNDNNDTVGWSNLQGVPEGEHINNTSAKDLKDLILGKGSPDAGPDHSVVSINNGQVAAAINTMTGPNNLFGLVETAPKSNIYTPQGTNAAGVPYTEVVYLLPVFDKSAYGGDPADPKYNQAAVVGCIAVKLVEVGTSPYNYITVTILDEPYVTPGYGGGAYYGVLSNVPKLVQ